MKVFILTLGCKVNQYESEAILEMFKKSGFKKTDNFKNADVLIINSCTVTSESDKKVRKILHRFRKENKKAVIVLTGCMVQAFPDKVNLWSQADIIVGNTDRSKTLEKVKSLLENRDKIEKIIEVKNYEKDDGFENLNIEKFDGRTRAFMKIEDGCNRFCSYCIIPFARGRVRSKKIEDIRKEAEILAENGYKEIVLVGINLSCYGQDLNLDLCDAVETVCSVNKVKRVRLGSLEPEKMDLDIIKRLSKCEKLCPQFHLSLQSGCDETLKRMNRHYSTPEYEEIVKNLREHFENAAITTDVMVGFAGETDEEFLESLNFVKRIGFSKIHVFPYSIRPGTKAAEFKNQINPEIKNIRTQKMLELSEKLNNNFLKSQIGMVEEVLFERRYKDHFFEGYTKNYVPVIVKTEKDLSSEILNVKITQVQERHCLGELH